MQYMGTDIREGIQLISSTNVTSNTSNIVLSNIFKPETLYMIEIMDYRPKLQQRTLQYRWLDSSDNTISHTNYQEGGQYTYTNVSSTGARYGANRTGGFVNLIGGVGNESDEQGEGRLWCVPNTANEKLSWHNIGYHGGDDASDNFFIIGAGGARLNTSATRATGMEWVCDFNSGGHQINNVTIRVYQIDAQLNKTPNIHQKREGVNWIQSKYLGEVPKGQGYQKLIEVKASNGDSAIELQGIFNANFKRYIITATDIMPVTDDKNFKFQWLDGASPETGTYSKGYFKADANGTSSADIIENQANSHLMYNLGTDNTEGGHGIFWCSPMSTNTPKTLFLRTLFQRSSVSGRDLMTRYLNGAVCYDDATAFTGIKFFFDAGNIKSGIIKVYGTK